jgi:DNA-binding winged helix-turn-helix (wHTH) protein
VRYYFAGFELNLATRELRTKQRTVHLDRRPLQLLTYLIQNRHRVVSNTELLARVWHAEAVSDSTIPTTIRSIRLALDDSAARQRLIRTLRGQGYRFIAPVDVHTDSLAASDPQTHFVGRDDEFSLLQHALHNSLGATPEVVLISGEPGIGKSRLLEEIARTATSLGAEVFAGRCTEDSGTPAFWPWTQILRSYTSRQDTTRLREQLGPFASVLLQMAPEIGRDLDLQSPAPPSLEPAQERFRLFDTVVRFLQSAARRAPLVLMLDDLHRADLSSLHLLRFAAHEIRETRLLIAAAYRSSELATDPRKRLFLGEIARLPIVRSITLAGLPLAAVEQLIAKRMPNYPDPSELASLLHEQTDGNPFFLTQLLPIVDERIRAGADLAQSITHLPAGVRDAVSLQVAALSTQAKDAIRAAAVLGREIDLGILADVLGETAEATLTKLGSAFRAGLLAAMPDRPSHIRFAHILLRNALYEEMLPSERCSLHRRVAESMEARYRCALDAHAAEIAHHFRQANDLRLTADYSLLAAQSATSRLAYEDAQVHCRDALAASEADPNCSRGRRASILIALGETEIRAGNRNAANAAFGEAAVIAREERRPDLLANAALGLAPGFFAIEVGVVDTALINLLEQALDALPPDDVLLRAQLMARLGLALSYSNDTDRSARLASDAVDLAERARDSSTLTYVLTARHPLLWGPTKTEDRLESGQRVIAAALAADHRELALVHRLFRLTDLLELGDIVAADIEISAFTALADELQIPQARWYKPLFRAMRSHLRGEIDRLETLAAQVASQGQQVGDRNATLSFLVLLEAARVEHGRFPELMPMIERVREQFPAIDIPWRCGTAWGYAESGMPIDARRHMQFVDLEALPRGVLGLSCSTLLGTAAAIAGEERACLKLYERLAPYHRHHAVVGYAVICLGSVSRTLGLLAARLGEWDAAARHFEYALQANARLDSPLWIARTQFDYAHALTLRAKPGDPRHARALAQRSAAFAAELRLSNLARRARSLLAVLDRGERLVPGP